MVDTKSITDGFVSGRLTAIQLNDQKVFVSFNVDFSAPSSIEIDFTLYNQQQQFGVPRTIFIDNSSNPNQVEVSVVGTNQYFEAPAYALGYYPLDCQTNSSKIKLDTVGNAADLVTVVVYNWEKVPVVWYAYGANNKDIPDKMQGAYPNGMATIDTQPYPNPVYIAGRGPAGELVALKVDATGRLDFSSAITIGGVTIADGDDVAEGATADALQFNPAGAGSVIALLKGLLKQTNSSGSTFTNIAASAASSVILAANTNRVGASITNRAGSAILYLQLNASAASSTNYTVLLNPNDYYELPFGYKGEIRAIWAAATGGCNVVEYT